MQLNEINIVLTTIDDKSTLTLENYPEIKLLLTDDGTANIEKFFSELIVLLLKEPFSLKLVFEGESPQLVKEVAEKYIERLNIEITNILQLPEYSVFSESATY